MSGESTYVPKTGVERWLDARLPILRFAHDSFVDYPTPRNLNYWYTFGAILMFMLVTMILSGVTLAMHYVPHVDHAFDSVQRIERDVPFGWLIQNIHSVGASMFFIAVYIHILKGMYYGSYKAPREVLWILGCVIYVLMIGTAFLGYTLPWGQMSFWGATVITELFGAIPLIGEGIRTWLVGGFAIDNATLNRFYALHYLMPFMIAGVVVLHVWALHVTGQNNPTGVDIKDKADTVPFTPYATVKDLVALALFAIMFGVFVFWLPDILGHADNFIKADPLVTPPEIVPEWYLLPFYAILRAITFDVLFIEAKLGGVIAMAGSLVVLFALPWLDTSKVRSMRYRPVARIAFLALIAATFVLGWCGAQNPQNPIHPHGDYSRQVTYTAASGPTTFTFAAQSEDELQREINAATNFGEAIVSQAEVQKPFYITVETLSQLLTAYYFAFFLIILPLLGLRETPGRVPDTISKPVLPRDVAATPAE